MPFLLQLRHLYKLGYIYQSSNFWELQQTAFSEEIKYSQSFFGLIPIAQVRSQAQGNSIVFILIPSPLVLLLFLSHRFTERLSSPWKVKQLQQEETRASLTQVSVYLLWDMWNWTLFSQGKESNPVSQILCVGPSKCRLVEQEAQDKSRFWEVGKEKACFATFQTDPVCGVWHACTTLPLGSWLLSLVSEVKKHGLLPHFSISYLIHCFLVQSLGRRVFPLSLLHKRPVIILKIVRRFFKKIATF